MGWTLSRRSWLHAAGLGSLLTGVTAWSRAAQGQPVEVPHEGHSPHHGHLLGTVGHVGPVAVDPVRYLRSWNFNHLPPDERARFYRETARPDGTM
ncbi:MAG: hypothetical protein ACRD2A_23340, partial [Vicinamibacterales bacterium]